MKQAVFACPSELKVMRARQTYTFAELSENGIGFVSQIAHSLKTQLKNNELFLLNKSKTSAGSFTANKDPKSSSNEQTNMGVSCTNASKPARVKLPGKRKAVTITLCCIPCHPMQAQP